MRIDKSNPLTNYTRPFSNLVSATFSVSPLTINFFTHFHNVSRHLMKTNRI